MNVTTTRNESRGARTNRRRQSPGRIVGFPPNPQYRRAPMHVPSFAASWPRPAIA